MDLLRIEQQRQALEENLQELRRSLKYWQTFEAEYEGLKEEIVERGGQGVDQAKLDEIAKTYEGELVTESVVRELAGLNKNGIAPRSAQQIVRDLERRLEYVQKNVETIQRRFFGAEAKLEEFDFAARRESGGEEMLPLTDIIEELDDDDNVVMSRLIQPEKSQAKLVESLRKAGLTDEDLEGGHKPEEKPPKPAITNASTPVRTVTPHIQKCEPSTPDISAANGDSTHEEPSSHRPPFRKKSVSFAADTKSAPEVIRSDSEDGKKSVTFAEKVAVAPAAPPPDTRTVQFSPQIEEIPPQPLGPSSPAIAARFEAQAGSDLQRELRTSFKPGDRVKMLNMNDEVVQEEIVIPESESEEDAKIRREMLEYHLNEVGHVVAQIDLDNDDYDYEDDNDDDTSSHITSSTYLDDEDTPYTSGLSEDDDDDDEEEEDEDEYGRTKGKVISEEYHKKMMEMQNRLIGNLGPSPNDEDLQNIDSEINPEDVRRLVIREKRNSTTSIASDSSDKKAKKRVSFAESLDVAEPDSLPLKARKHVDGETVPPMSDLAPERSMGAAYPIISQEVQSKTSKLKQDHPRRRAGNSDLIATNMGLDGSSDCPSGPPGRVLADSLVERPSSSKHTSAPSIEPDLVTERRQLAAEYYRRRNEIVRQQGGFKVNRNEEEEMGELMEERPDGSVKKVSRFKAARIQPRPPLQ
ncbi:MAG: hypothetical protein FE78DRAFT_87384 [Acidomyces sp. 'richmondensis']|nr:MAG: hypothetical protein FE78DRAFT_87384 [Acidomyces sp. 'richmondensis']